MLSRRFVPAVIAIVSAVAVQGRAIDTVANHGDVSCRNVATALTAQMTATGEFNASMKTSCKFDSATRQSSCTVQYSDNRGTSMTSTSVSTYNSAADLIDEITVIPPLNYALTTVGTQTSNRGTTTGSVTNTFDANRRIVKTVNTSTSGDSTTSYTAWDAAGRPTGATDVGKGFNNTRTISYDDAARTKTTVVNGGPLRTVETFDADGIQIETLATSGGAAVASKTAITVTASQRLCK